MLLWTPVDFPPFPVSEKFLSYAKHDKFYFWDFCRLTEKRSNPYEVSQWLENIQLEFPEVVDWVSMLPSRTLRTVKLNRQTQVVRPHVDFTNPAGDKALWGNNCLAEPCGYRVLLSGRRADALYVINSAGERVYCTMPTCTDTYLLRQTDGIHGVDADHDRTTLYLHLEVDPILHKAILQKSLVKYSSYTIYDTK